jgi:hypothetical protein
MNAERDIDDEALQMWNRFNLKEKIITTTTRVKTILYGDQRFKDVEETVKEDHGTLQKIVRGILGIAGSVDKKKK